MTISIHQPSWWFFIYGHSPHRQSCAFSAAVVCDGHDQFFFPENGS